MAAIYLAVWNGRSATDVQVLKFDTELEVRVGERMLHLLIVDEKLAVVNIPCNGNEDYLGLVDQNTEPALLDASILIGFYPGEAGIIRAYGWKRSIGALSSGLALFGV